MMGHNKNSGHRDAVKESDPFHPPTRTTVQQWQASPGHHMPSEQEKAKVKEVATTDHGLHFTGQPWGHLPTPI